jgi:lipoprotein NlpI
VREFASSAEKLNRAEWPWPIVDLFLGTSNPEIMRAATHDANSPDTSRDRVCEADFFFGIYQQEKGAGDEARRLFDSATKTCPQDYVEYRAAKRELERQR